MFNNFLQILLGNIIQNYYFVKNDFVGFQIDFTIFITFFTNLIVSLLLIFLCYSFGKKVFELFKRTEQYLINIALGYILISSLITIIGFLSLLHNFIIMGSIALISLYSFLATFSIRSNLFQLYNDTKNTLIILRNNRLVFLGVILFILIAFINLFNPEIREDQYHVDFPRIYLNEHTIMIPPRESLHVSGSSMMAEMFYLPAIFITNSAEVARHLHFLFYLLVIFSLIEFSKLINYKFSAYTPLLFVTAPVVIHETSSMYVDFQWIFLFLIAILLYLKDKKNFYVFFVIGLFLGGMLSTKLWSIILIPALILFITKDSWKTSVKNISFLLLGAFLISFIWFLRAYVLTGDLFYPALYTHKSLEGIIYTYNLSRYFSFNTNAINPLANLNVFSPIFFVGIAFFTFHLRKNVFEIKKILLLKLSVIVLLLYLLVNYPYGRYLLGLYVLLIFFSSLFIYTFVKAIPKGKSFLYALTLIVFGYYFINSVIVLPYSLGLSNKNKYLSRILVRDNSSYFNFDKKFDKYITSKDKIAMYNFHGYYYANFNFLDVNFIFNDKHKDFSLLKKEGFTKLIIRGGDINWFCNQIGLNGCNADKHLLVSSYSVYPYYYLYLLK